MKMLSLRLATALTAVLALSGCDDATSARAVLGRYVAIGASTTAGVAADGLVYDGQSSAYPAQIARAARVSFEEARVQAPGCVPPIVAPLLLDRTLSGRRAFTAPRDTTCNGLFADSVFAQNVAVPEMTTYQALRFTTDSVARLGDARARASVEHLLLAGYSQVTQAQVAGASLVSVELGLTEIVRAIRSGRMVAATHETYRGDTAFTYVPLDVWRPVFDTLMSVLVDSARIRRGVVLGVRAPDALPLLRRASTLHGARDSLLVFGVALSDDCAASTNWLSLAKVATAAATAARASATQTVSCADVPDVADSVLTDAELATLVALRDAMNAQLRLAATARGWAYADTPLPSVALGAYTPRTHLTATRPFGTFVSLDGVHPSADGHFVIAGAVAEALDATYGLGLRVETLSPLMRPR